MTKIFSIITLCLLLLFLSCQKKETVLETEQKALYSVFNKAVDSIYWKLEKNSITNNKNKKLIINDSISTLWKSGYSHFKWRFKDVNQTYIDTINEKVEYKIDFQKLKKTANFDYKYRSTLPLSYKENITISEYALPGVLTFGKILFDKERTVGAMQCVYGNGDIWDSKHFTVYVKKVNNNWELDQVYLQHLIY